MDFVRIIPLITKEFEKARVEYALIGGFAMGAIGLVRATADLDFMVNNKDLPRVEEIMKKYSYRSVYKTENVSQYVSDIKIFGEIDFLHAFRPVSLTMLKHAKEMAVLDGKHMIKVLRPEDIIGLKIQASVNNSERKNRDYSDINSIMEHYKAKSAALKKDFEVMRENRRRLLKKAGRIDVDAYMEFLNFANAFAGHAVKPFHKIKGNNFKI